MECQDCGRTYPTDGMASARQCDGCAAPEKPYAIRDAAFKEWWDENFDWPHQGNGLMEKHAQAAFNAGWKARKAAAYMTAAYGGDGLRIGTEPEDDWMKS